MSDVYFIGIKGTGMASMARIMHQLGHHVSGSDIEKHVFTEDPLRALQIPIYAFDANNIKDNMTVIIGNAFPEDHVEVVAALDNPSVTTYKYHEYLGKMMEPFRVITVSGSHGKTTTTTLLKDAFDHVKRTGYLIGDGRGDLYENSEYFMVEACEFRHHFLAYHPDVAIMTNFEIDHVDYFKSEADYLHAFEQFAAQVKERIIVWGDDPHLKSMDLGEKVVTYGFLPENDYQIINMVKSPMETTFDILYEHEILGHFEVPLVGDHMILNATAVIAAGVYEGLSVEDIEAGLRGFQGALRRFVVEEGKENVYIDDYAHHPTEIDVTLKAVRTRFPEKKVVAIFKPHRTGRVKYFVDEFASALSQADAVYLMPFTSIDDYDPGAEIDITYLQNRIEGAEIIDDIQTGVILLEPHTPAVFVFMSSKDIYDLKDALKIKCID